MCRAGAILIELVSQITHQMRIALAEIMYILTHSIVDKISKDNNYLI